MPSKTNVFKPKYSLFYMAQEEVDYSSQILSEIAVRLKDMEEKQRILKDRLLLIGQNLIEIREKTATQTLEMKKTISVLKNDFERMKSFTETLSGELPKFARKDDIEMLSKQAKMFQPLEFVRKSELEKLKSK
jgi:hypothetical protein